MKPHVLNQINRLCREQTREFAQPFGGTPTSQRFGDTADPGTGTTAARIDHRHGLEELPADSIDSLDQFALVFLDFMHTTTTGFNDAATWGTLSFSNARDVAGETGGFGCADLTTATPANSGAGLVIGQNASGNPSAQQLHYVPRLRRLEGRVRPVLLATDLPNMRFVFGGFRSSTHARLDLITDGVYFELDTDASGVGTIHCKIRSGSVDTFDVDTNVSLRTDGTNVLFEFFRIDYDGETTAFYMGTPADDGTVTWSILTSTTEALPGASNLVCGFGAAIMTEALLGAGKVMVVDYMLFKGLRIAE